MDEREGIFKQWLDQHKGLMFKVVRAYASGPEDQDDLFQDILLGLWASIPAFRGEAKVSTWIYKVALNTALAWRRSEKKRRRREPLIKSNEKPHLGQGRAEVLENREMLERLYGEIRKLPKVDTSLILLYLDGLSYREMAEILGISENNIGVKLNRMKRRLGESMKGAGNGL